jgi:hypothetical protein
VDICKGKRKYDYEAPMTSSLSDCTWLEKDWKFRLSTTWHPSLHSIIILFYLIYPSHIFLATPLFSFFSFSIFNHSLLFSHTHLYFSYFSFFLFHTHIFLFNIPSLDIFISCRGQP